MAARPYRFAGLAVGQQDLTEGRIGRGLPVKHRHGGIPLRVGIDQQEGLRLAGDLLAMATASETARVVLPTPPLCDTIPMTRTGHPPSLPTLI